MILKFILFTLLCQIVLYLLSDKFSWKNGKWVILALSLIGHFYFFPSYVHNQVNPLTGEGRCAMQLIGIFGAFWFLGGAFTLVTHYLDLRICKAHMKH